MLGSEAKKRKVERINPKVRAQEGSVGKRLAHSYSDVDVKCVFMRYTHNTHTHEEREREQPLLK